MSEHIEDAVDSALSYLRSVAAHISEIVDKAEEENDWGPYGTIAEIANRFYFHASHMVDFVKENGDSIQLSKLEDIESELNGLSHIYGRHIHHFM